MRAENETHERRHAPGTGRGRRGCGYDRHSPAPREGRPLNGVIESPILVLTPVYNDWHAAAAMLGALDAELARAGRRAEVVMVDDGSPEPCDPALFDTPRAAIGRLWRLELRRNLGHQRAIAVGQVHLLTSARFGALVVMDADGEDLPSDVPRLLDRFEALGGGTVVFAERMKRSEGPVFATLYWLYRAVHPVLTGVRVRVGNFSVLPRSAVERLTLMPELWNHYAASVFKARLAHAMVPTRRGTRAAGRTSMNFVSLVVHGLSAISVYSEIVGVRFLIATGILLGLLCGLVVVALAAGLGAWAWIVAGLLLVLAVQVGSLSLFFVFGALGGRQGASFIPARECGIFVRGLHELTRGDRAQAGARPGPAGAGEG